jgi:phosphohistidine phosphatase
MELILFRHGKAEDRSGGKTDADRPLTPLGRKKIKAAAKGLAQLFLRERIVRIWTSPLVRAEQTAEMLHAAFPKKYKIQIVPAIAEGHLDALALDFQGFGEGDTIIVVGHEPFLSQWAEEICGARLPFKPGSAACIQLKRNQPPTGSLLWFMRAGQLATLCPPPSSTKK